MRSSSIHILAGVIAVFMASVSATTLERLSMGDMTDQSTMIVRGTVTSSAGELRNGVISTHYQFAVSETWKGSSGTKVDIYVPGGTAQGFLQSVPGAPVLSPGVEYVIFLWTGPSGRPQIIGLSQGLFSVVSDKSGLVYLNRGSVAEMMIDAKTGRPVTDENVHVPASTLKSFVKKRQAVSVTQ
ncbi:MAG TPA: hypothetical protein VGL53_02415 [Bryobacteraceae bacterium]|jgi:hypothetical protein